MITQASKKAKKKWSLTPKGRYAHQKSAAQQRKVEWLFTFDTWWDVWQKSGHWEERGVSGYQMCRFKDEGPYSPENVYIAHNIENKRDAYKNGKIPKPPINNRLGVLMKPPSDDPKVNALRKYQREWKRNHKVVQHGQ